MGYEVMMRKVCLAFLPNYSKYSYSKVTTEGEIISEFVIFIGKAAL